MTYKEARVYLDKVSKYGSVLGLDTIRELLHELGNPQDDLKFIHIAGTNGKGSILAYTSTILCEAGYRTGRYISPTVISYLERIQVNGVYISEEAFARLTGKVQRAIARMETDGKTSPTVFEVETAIAFLYFKEQNCDLVVLECGMGGDLDATNIINTTLCAAFASISPDHLGILGNTLEEITLTKSGIIKPGCTVVSAPQKPEVTAILKEMAAKKNCPFHQADLSALTIHKEDYTGQQIDYRNYSALDCPLAGPHQAENVITASEIILALNSLGYPVKEDDIRRGLQKTFWPGRFTCICKKPLFFIDGAHNEDAAKRLRETLDRYFPGKKFIYITGVFKDKEYGKIASIMGPFAKSVHTISLPDENRTLPAETLAEIMRNTCAADVPVRAELSIENAVQHSLEEASESESMILAFGSLSYLGQLIQIIKGSNNND